MQLEPRERIPWILSLLAPLVAVAIALLLCATLIAWSGSPVFAAYGVLLKGALGSRFAVTETLAQATPLMLTGLAAAVAFRSKLWNIGGEGQFYMGALAATLIGTGVITWPPLLMIPLLILAGAIAGGMLLVIPAILKTQFKVDEVVTTLLLNFIILLFVSYLLEGPIKDPLALGWPQAKAIITEAEFPKLIARSRVHFGLILAILAAVGIWILNRLTVWGYEMKAVGANDRAAWFAGIPVHAVIWRTALLSGGLAGIAGVSEVAGLKGYLTLDLSPGFGYTGIVVAMLAQLHPIGVLAAALFVAGIYVGADTMNQSFNIPTYLADVVVATSLLCMLICILFTRYRIRWQ